MPVAYAEAFSKARASYGSWLPPRTGMCPPQRTDHRSVLGPGKGFKHSLPARARDSQRKTHRSSGCLNADYVSCFVNNSVVNFYNIAFTETITRRLGFFPPRHLDIKVFNGSTQNDSVKSTQNVDQAAVGSALCSSRPPAPQGRPSGQRGKPVSPRSFLPVLSPVHPSRAQAARAVVNPVGFLGWWERTAWGRFYLGACLLFNWP